MAGRGTQRLHRGAERVAGAPVAAERLGACSGGQPQGLGVLEAIGLGGDLVLLARVGVDAIDLGDFEREAVDLAGALALPLAQRLELLAGLRPRPVRRGEGLEHRGGRRAAERVEQLALHGR